MDLRLEKADLLECLGVPDNAVDSYHFDEPPPEEMLAAVRRSAARPFSPRIQANQGAVRYIAERTDLLPVGMLIGPFSLMTKLVGDPITPVAMAGSGTTADEDAGVRKVERCLQLASAAVERSARAQIAAGAKALVICEPAANIVYLSPRQMKRGADILERFVLEPNRRIRAVLEQCGTDLIFHDCGELLTDMVRQFAVELRPAILSLGGSRRLWEDASVVPKDIVLFGNLPTKTFYSDAAMPVEEVVRLTRELAGNMAGVRAPAHPRVGVRRPARPRVGGDHPAEGRRDADGVGRLPPAACDPTGRRRAGTASRYGRPISAYAPSVHLRPGAHARWVPTRRRQHLAGAAHRAARHGRLDRRDDASRGNRSPGSLCSARGPEAAG